MNAAKMILMTLMLIPCFGSVMELARNGQAIMAIVIPASTNRFEDLALQDLKQYLEAMTRAEFKVVPENQIDPNQAAIYLGHTEFAVRNGIVFSELQKEEWILKSSASNLIITGGRPIGTFYGVWAFLQKAGCWSLSMDQDVIPEKPLLQISGVDERRKPCFSGRVIYDAFAVDSTIMGIPGSGRKAYQMWLLRNHINGKQHDIALPLYQGDMTWVSTNPPWHTLSLYVSPDRYFKTNPEYFSMNEEGRRFRPRDLTSSGSVCASNPEVGKIALASLRSFIEQDRKKFPQEEWPVLYDITQLDLTPYICKCPNCLAIIAEEGGCEHGLWLRFINYIAEEIQKEYPEIMIRTYAGHSSQIPKITRPANNVLLQITDMFVTCDYFRPLSHPLNSKAREKFISWKSTGARLAVWDYWNMSMYFDPPRLETILDTLQPDLQFFASLQIETLFLEAEKHSYKPQNFMDMNYFIATKLMVDPNADVEGLKTLFLQGYYGKAATDLAVFLEQLRHGVRAYPHSQPGMNPTRWDYMTDQFLLESYLLLNKAAECVPADSIYRRRVHDELIPLIWLVVEKRHLYEKVFAEANISMERLKTECYDYCMAHLARYEGEKLDADSPYARTRKDFHNEYARITAAPLPVPERFQSVAEENLRVFGKYHFIEKPEFLALVKEDPEAMNQLALRSAISDTRKHGPNQLVKDPRGKWSFYATEFGYGAQKHVVINDIPQDEKYHWYKLPGLKLTDEGSFYGHIWYIHIPLASAYRIDDGFSDANLWDCWFSVKFTGPAYVKDSQQENAIWLDSLVLVKPDTPGAD